MVHTRVSVEEGSGRLRSDRLCHHPPRGGIPWVDLTFWGRGDDPIVHGHVWSVYGDGTR